MLHHDVDGTQLARSLGTPSPIGTVPLEDRFRRSLPAGATFKNPILPSPSADPWVILHNGYYYSCESYNQEEIRIRKAKCFTELRQATPRVVWSAPNFGANSKSVWAPELHLINGRWYIYYAADDGLNENHRMWVLEGITDDPAGPYRCKGCLETSGWAIDGTVLKAEDGALYYIWSGWPGKINGQQYLYIAPMANPWTLGAERTLIAKPEHGWECVDMAICEGPQVLQRDGRTFVVYSASGSWTEDYCLGMIELTGKDPLNASAWKKLGCVFCKTDYVWGIGHCSFVKSQDGTEDWMIYHAKTKRKKGWNDRNVRAQRFSWTANGQPDFGVPMPVGRSVPVPSGSNAVTLGL
ncbi:MAG TPA: glycoside hydrolase family 43 protein [Verrucomicrobiae bacterium]